MNTRIGYNIKVLVDKLFPCHVLKQIQTEHDSEEHYREERAWYITYPEYNRVRFYHSCFSDSQTIYSDEGEEIYARSSNVNSYDKSIVRINQIKGISPQLTMIDEAYAEATKELSEWIFSNYCDANCKGESIEDILNAISMPFTLDRTLEFEGVWSPVKSGGGWASSSKSLQMNGVEIDTILRDIDDILLRKKVEALINHYGKKVHEE